MKTLVVGTLVTAFILGPTTSLVLAYHCPKLVKECQALVAKMQKRRDTDKTKVAAAERGCKEALRLHKSGKHKDSVIKAGEAITWAGESVK